MARDFTKTSSTNYLNFGVNAMGPTYQGAAVTSLSIWTYADTYSTSPLYANGFVIFSAGPGGIGTNLSHFGNIDATGGTRYLRFAGKSQSGDANQVRTGTVDVPLGQWNHIFWVLDYTNDRMKSWVNGVADVDSAVTFGSNTYNHGGGTAVDVLSATTITATLHWDGGLAEFAMWNADVSADVAILAAGASPRHVFPANLINYVPLWGRQAPEWNLAGGPTGAVVGSVPARDHASVPTDILVSSRPSGGVTSCL